MNRRTFLALFGIGAVGAAVASALPEVPGVDVERLLWTPGEKTIFVPPGAGWTPIDEVVAQHGRNMPLTVSMITKEALRILQKKLTFETTIYRAYRPTLFPRLGETVQVRVPQRFGHGPVAGQVTARMFDRTQSEMLDPPTHDDDVDTYRQRVLEPAVAALAAKIPRGAMFGELELPRGAASAARISSDTASLRVAQYYDINTDRTLMRLDTIVASPLPKRSRWRTRG